MAAAEGPSLAQSPEKFLQIPTHQLETEHFVRGGRRRDYAANIAGEIIGIEAALGRILVLVFGQKKLLGPTRPPRRVQTIGKQIAPRTGDRTDDVATPRISQLVKETTHGLLDVEV